MAAIIGHAEASDNPPPTQVIGATRPQILGALLRRRTLLSERGEIQSLITLTGFGAGFGFPSTFGVEAADISWVPRRRLRVGVRVVSKRMGVVRRSAACGLVDVGAVQHADEADGPVAGTS